MDQKDKPWSDAGFHDPWAVVVASFAHPGPFVSLGHAIFLQILCISISSDSGNRMVLDWNCTVRSRTVQFLGETHHRVLLTTSDIPIPNQHVYTVSERHRNLRKLMFGRIVQFWSPIVQFWPNCTIQSRIFADLHTELFPRAPEFIFVNNMSMKVLNDTET